MSKAGASIPPNGNDANFPLPFPSPPFPALPSLASPPQQRNQKIYIRRLKPFPFPFLPFPPLFPFPPLSSPPLRSRAANSVRGSGGAL